jgi:hypothetical protein
LRKVTVGEIHADRVNTNETIAREVVFLAGPCDAWLLPEDGVTDYTAVETAADGQRRVRLTMAERVAAASYILVSGGSVRNVCRRLGLPAGTEFKWEQLQSLESRAMYGLAVLAGVFAYLIPQLN